MTDPQTSEWFGDFSEQLAEARSALDVFSRGTARKAADDVGVAFERAGSRIGRALGGAALGGEASFKRLAKVILEEFATIALDKMFAGAGSAKPDVPFYGARAAGGPVNAGGAYLVGERGPELFMPRQGGEIGVGGGAVNVHFHFAEASDASSVARHQGQIAAQIARAVAYGRRNL
jgi:phage-related minor tail protein